MTIPAGRPIREVLDAMLLGFCEHHFDGKKFTELDLSDQLIVIERFESELGARANRLKRFLRNSLAGSRV